jgi:DNA (cytosine-5)-methyltransferase 1
LFVDPTGVRSRLLTPREAARLMGVPDDYPLPDGQTAALYLIGDAVCVPVVRWLSEHLLAPLAGAAATRKSA